MLKQIIKALKKLLKPLPLAIVLCFLFACLIFFFGQRVGMRGIYPFKDVDVRYWVSLGLGVLGGLLLIVQIIRWLMAWRANRQATEKRAPSQEELEAAAMDRFFSKAEKVIQTRWSGSGRSIYGLPWYLFLGKKDAGKTSIIENGDLRFPIDHEIRAEIGEIGEFDACDFTEWRVSGNEAVILDLAGEFFIPHEDRNSVQKVLWHRFLRNLQKIRPRRPLNGVVLAVDVVEFAGYTQAERENYASLVRRTVDDLVENLGTRLTIHVVFTKFDLLAGFADFFEGLTASEREKLFGFHFLHAGHHTDDWTAQFSKQYTEFAERLNKSIKRRMLSLKSERSRQEAFTFYRGMLGMQAPMQSFLLSALSPDKFSTPPLVRGIYFVSNRQENAPKNIFLEAVGQRYQLPVPLYGTSQGASFPYFITGFFKKALFPEAGLAGNNIAVETRYKRRIWTAACIAVLACLGGGIYWKQKYDQNIQQAELVLEKTRSFSHIEADGGADETGARLLEPLNTIREATFEFGDYKQVNPVVEQVTLYQGNEIGPIADTAYQTVLNDEFAPTLTDGVGKKLRETCPKGSDDELELLRVYRMLGDVDGRDDRVLRKYFGNMWQRAFEAQAETQNQLNGHLEYMLTSIPRGYELDEYLVATAQKNLGALTPYRRVYSSLRSDAERQLPNPIEFSTSVGASFSLVYEPYASDQAQARQQAAQDETPSKTEVCGRVEERIFSRKPFEIPRVFTATEFKEFFVPQNEKVALVAANDLWVLGQLNTTEYSEADYLRIQKKVRELYVDDYVRIWRQSLNDMKVREFRDIRDATEILRALSGSESPIRRVAQLVTENATIVPPEGVVLEGDEAAGTELPIDPNREAGLLIYDSFGEIRRMLEDKPEGGQPGIDQIEEALIALYDYMKTIRDAPDPHAKALEVAIKRAKLVDEDPIYVLHRIAERTPAPFGDHLEHVADEAWRIVMINATEELNRRWHDEIYGDYQRLIAGKYPFNRASEIDLPVEDFEAFFRPGGILETFYQDELLVFVEETTGEPRVIDGQSLAVDPSFAANLRKAIEITKSFFDASGELSVEFKVQTVNMSANLARSVLNFEGQVVINSHGPSKPISIIWPNLVDQPASSRVDMAPLFGTGRAFGKQYDGAWSWLRLYDNASKTNFQNNSVDVSFTNANGQSATFRVRPEARVNPFFNSPLSEFSLPSHLRKADG